MYIHLKGDTKAVCCFSSSSVSACDDDAVQVHALVRHGARAPYDRSCWRWADVAATDLLSLGSSINSGNIDSGSSTGPRHVGLAPAQDALRSDAERCPPVGHQRHGDCAAAAAMHHMSVPHVERDGETKAGSTVSPDTKAAEALQIEGQAATRELTAVARSSSGAFAEEASKRPEAATSALGKVEPPWECAIQEELRMTDSRTLRPPLLQGL